MDRLLRNIRGWWVGFLISLDDNREALNWITLTVAIFTVMFLVSYAQMSLR